MLNQMECTLLRHMHAHATPLCVRLRAPCLKLPISAGVVLTEAAPPPQQLRELAARDPSQLMEQGFSMPSPSAAPVHEPLPEAMVLVSLHVAWRHRCLAGGAGQLARHI